MKPSAIKSIRTIIYSLTFPLWFIPCLKAQEKTNEEMIQSMAEEISSTGENSDDLELFTENIHYLEIDPVRINLGSLKENRRLFFLSEYQIRALSEYVKKNGKIISLNEISSVSGFDNETAAMIAPFITLEESINGDNYQSRKPRQTLLSIFSVKPGFEDPDAEGSQWKILTKYRFGAGRFSGGFTSEKDAGEKYFSGTPLMPDFFSGFLSFKGPGILREVIAGDFSAQFGTGAVINTGFRSGLSVAVPGVLTPLCDIRPHTSTEENNFFRGMAVTLGKGKIETTLFASYNKIDATIDISGDSLNKSVTSLYKSGIHNTEAVLGKKDVLKEFTWGINTAVYFRSVSAGIIVTENIFSLPFSSVRSGPEDLYDFCGTRNSLAGIWYSLSAGRFIISGEAASGPGIKYAFTESVSFVPADRISFSFLYRYYSPGFISFHGKSAFSGSAPANEEAVLGSLKFEAGRNFFISAGTEFRRRPWAAYLTCFPSSSLQSEVRANFMPHKYRIETVYRFRSCSSDLNVTRGVPDIKDVSTHSVTLKIKHIVSDRLSLAARADIKNCNSGISPGMMLCNDLLWQPAAVPVRLWFRYALFSTGGWDTRIYAYENDLTDSFSIPALYGKGSRTYFMIEYKPVRPVMLRVKYGITSKMEDSGMEGFSNELKLQIRVVL